MTKADLANLVIALVSVAIGFGLAVVWDQYKVARDERAELNRAERSVSQEIAVNLRLIKSDLESLNADIVAADKSQEIILPLDPLMTAAGQTAYLKGSFEVRSVDMAEQLREIYAGIEVVNQRISARDLYRATNGAMTNFDQRRKIMNEDIKSRLERLGPALQEMTTKLREE